MNFLKKLFKKKGSTNEIPPPSKKSILKFQQPKCLGCRCCLYYSYLVNTKTKQRIPLKNLNYDIEILDSLAYVSITQEYFNDDPNNTIETEFLFSIANEACFYDFEAEIDGKIVKGKIKEKEEAKKEYDENIKKGNMAAYSEISSEQQDLIKIKVGNIPPKKPVTIKFKYMQQLEICLNKFWRLTIPSTLTPRYQSRHQDSQDPSIRGQNQESQIDPKDEERKYTWNIKTAITSASAITFVKSPSHEVSNEFLDKSLTKCELKFLKEEVPNKDYTILFKNDAVNKPNWILAERENDQEFPFCAMLSFFPQFNSASDNDAYEAYKQNSAKNEYRISALKSRGEFIFVLDRSGSMSGNRIKMATQALVIFLKSMPPDSYFNVLSFGSKYDFMFKGKSEKYSEKALESAIKMITEFDANYGGTELYDPLKGVYGIEKIKGYPQNVFLLTDGGISNTNQVLELIAKNNEQCRVYTIGIGNGCSQELIVEGARAGKGKHEFIGDNEDMNAKIIGLLQDSLTPFLTDIKLEYDKNIVEMMSPVPDSVNFIRKNEALNFYVFFNKKFAETKMSSFKLLFVDSLKKERQIEEINIRIDDLTLKKDFLHRYGVFKMIKTVSRSISYEQNYQNDVFLAKKSNIDEFCLKSAIEYQILTPFTAFICVIQERDPKDTSHFITKKVEIPAITSVDYSNDSDLEDEFDARSWSMNCKKLSSPPKKAMNKARDMSPPNYMMAECCCRNSELARKIESDEDDEEAEEECKEIEALPDISKKEMSNDLEIPLERPVSKMGNLGQTITKNKEENLGPKNTINKDDLLKILGKQKLGGFWEDTKEIFALLQLKADDVFKQKPQELNKESWLTIIVLMCLEVRFGNEQGTWKLIAQKAMEYLEDNNVSYSNYKGKASEIVK